MIDLLFHKNTKTETPGSRTVTIVGKNKTGLNSPKNKLEYQVDSDFGAMYDKYRPVVQLLENSNDSLDESPQTNFVFNSNMNSKKMLALEKVQNIKSKEFSMDEQSKLGATNCGNQKHHKCSDTNEF